MTKNPPSPAYIRAARSNLNLNIREFEDAIGYSTDGRVGIALESGTRGGRPFELTGPAAAALAYLQGVFQAYGHLKTGDTAAAEATLRRVLPEKLQ